MSSETITSLSSTIVKTTEEAVKLVKTKEEIISQVNLVKGNVKLLETAIKIKLEEAWIIPKKKQRSRHLVWHSINSCFKGRVCTGLIANLSIKDPLCFLNKAFNNFQRKIKIHRQKSMLKVNVVLVCNFIKPQSGDIDKKTFATKNHTIDINTNLKTWYRDNVIHTLANKLEEFSEKDSGGEHRHMSVYLILYHFPIKLNDIRKFEKLNGLCINLYCIEKKNVLPLSLSEYRNSNREPINLLVLSTENSNNNNSSPEFSKERTLFHFAWIKKMSALLSKQLSSHGHKTFICYRCLNHFSSDGLLKKTFNLL
ncbi:hypothetical protein NQ315_008304 [Exocentrus adspersus]|uniref:Uncharacterized protein n=1 Tax=Exocentrus adspersus TaxID=1586481 RepID=A0AAV8VN29_9CUCU|nr:hypothetical protein NQ315_008304 [Exocentrus adspersus]